MKNDDIEDLFKKSFDNYEPEVRSSVWKNIKVFLKWGGLAFFINTLINKIGLTTIVTVVVSLTAVVGGAIAYNWNDDKKTTLVVEQALPTKDSINTVATTQAESTPAVTVANNSTEINGNEASATTVVKTSNKNDESIAAIQASTTNGTAPLIVDFSNAGKGKESKWIFGNDNQEIVNTNPVHVFDSEGTYKVLLTSRNADGGVDTDTLSIEVSGPNPKAITVSPNGDGVNDEFKLNIQKMASISSKIIDKNGKVVYQAAAAGEWNGKDLQGNELPAGFYYYTIQAEGLNGKQYNQKGIVNLKR